METTTWRNSDPGAIYDVDFTDADGDISIDGPQYEIWSLPNKSGAILQGQNQIAPGPSNLTANWGLSAGAFSISLQEGINYVSVKVYDTIPNIVSVTDVFYIKKDTIAPTTTDNWTDVWTSAQTVTMTLTPSDGSGSGVQWTKYCVDTANSCDPTTGTTGTTVSVTCSSGSACTQYVRYASRDNANNTEITKSKTARQDLQAPTTTDDWTDVWTSAQTVTVILTPSDGSGSGIQWIKYCVDTANSCDPAGTSGTSVSITCSTGSDCIQYVRYTSRDNANNTEITKSETVRQDRQLPTVVDLQTGDDTWYATSPGAIYNVDFFDNASGSLLATAQYTVWSAPSLSTGTGMEVITWTNIAAGINAASYTASWSVNFASLTEGFNWVSARVYDNANNVSTVATDVFYIKKDTVAPTFIYASPPQGGFTVMYESATSSVIDVDFGWLGIGASTEASPLQWADYKIGPSTSTWLNIFTGPLSATYTTNWSVDFSAATEGYNEISLRAADAAGNMATDAYASNTAEFWYWKDTSPDLAISKTALCTSPIGYQNLGGGGGVNDCVPGALIHYTDTYSNSSAMSINTQVKDGVPTYTTYVAGSIKLNSVSKTDADDADECDYNVTIGDRIVCNIGSLPKGGSGTLEYDVTID